MNKIDQLKELIAIANKPYFSVEEGTKLFSVLIGTVKELKQTNNSTYQELANKIDNIISKYNSLAGSSEYSTIYFKNEISALKKTLSNLKLQHGKDGEDGKDYILTQSDLKKIADLVKVPDNSEKIAQTVLNSIVLPDDSGERIVEKINELPIEEDKQIDAKHIKGLPELKGQVSAIQSIGNRVAGVSKIIAGENVTITPETGTGVVTINAEAGSSTTFTSLTDTPDSYTGNASKAVFVKVDETGLEFKDAITPDLTPYAKLDGSNQPFTGNLNVSKTSPEYKLTDTNDTRLTRVSANNQANLYNEVEVEGGSGTGGTITYDGDYTIHTFTTDGNFVSSGISAVEVLVVAGGGSGGAGNAGCGGGGAGGYQYVASHSIGSGTYPITIGAGGASVSSGNAGNNGGDSVFDTITAKGGGAGAYEGTSASQGGSGGGGSYNRAGATALGSQGNDGGAGNSTGPYYAGGGGGGAGEDGHNASVGVCGAGGNGLSCNITGSSVYYAGGGGGGGRDGSTGGAGGNGGGGAGTLTSNGNGTAGTDGRGGGGGGASNNGSSGKGGSGVVIIRYLVSSSVQETTIIESVDASGGLLGLNKFGDASGTTIVRGNTATIQTNSLDRISVLNGGNVGVGVTTPTARLHIAAGSATAGTAPIKLTAGTVNTTPEAGAIEFDGTDYWLTI